MIAWRQAHRRGARVCLPCVLRCSTRQVSAPVSALCLNLYKNAVKACKKNIAPWPCLCAVFGVAFKWHVKFMFAMSVLCSHEIKVRV